MHGFSWSLVKTHHHLAECLKRQQAYFAMSESASASPRVRQSGSAFYPHPNRCRIQSIFRSMIGMRLPTRNYRTLPPHPPPPPTSHSYIGLQNFSKLLCQHFRHFLPTTRFLGGCHTSPSRRLCVIIVGARFGHTSGFSLVLITLFGSFYRRYSC